MVKIRLKRVGKKREPYFRVVVTDSRNKQSGRVIEEIGKYYPKSQPSQMEVVSERVQYWLGVGAQPSEPVHKILEILGEIDKFHGGPGKSQLKIAEPKVSREELIQQASDLAEQIKADVHAQAAKKAKEKSAEAEDKPEDSSSEGATETTAPETADAESTETATAEATADSEIGGGEPSDSKSNATEAADAESTENVAADTTETVDNEPDKTPKETTAAAESTADNETADTEPIVETGSENPRATAEEAKES
jgi:small subunit ribosomal protein S16